MQMNGLLTFLIVCLLLEASNAFVGMESPKRHWHKKGDTTTVRLADDEGEEAAMSTTTDEFIVFEEEKFKIITCMSTSCSQKRKALGMDPLSTFGAMFARAQSSRVQVEEGPCLGSCKKAPCIAIEHDDFIGSVALEGMTDDEFALKAYVSPVVLVYSLELKFMVQCCSMFQTQLTLSL
jgi:hypothetical protein